MVLIRSHDALFRYVFGEPEQMAELVRALLPPEAAADIDWSTLTRIDGTFVDQALQERITDLLFSARAHDGIVLLHLVVDHKSHDDPFASLQMGHYALRIHDRWRLDHPEARTLPPILAVIVHHGDKPWRSPRSLDELIDVSACGPSLGTFLRPLQMRVPFVLLDLATMDEDAIAGLRLSIVGDLTLRFLQFLRSQPADVAVEHIVRWQRLVALLLLHPRGKDVVFALFSWFLAGAPESHQTLRTVMQRIDEENVPMRSLLDMVLDRGHERGRQEGLQEALQPFRAALSSQLHRHFGELSPTWSQRLATADAHTLQSWSERLLDVGDIDELLEDGA
jgi:hypothetical protein